MTSYEDIHAYDIQPGDHLFVWRKAKFYSHHGIAISSNDAQRIQAQYLSASISNIEPVMILEQNSKGLQIVTLQQFRLENFLSKKYAHRINRAQYSVDPLHLIVLKRSGTCYKENRDESDKIVQRAIDTFNDEEKRDFYSKYSILYRNCEHFAYYCCTGIIYYSEQVQLLYSAVKCFANSSAHMLIKTIYNQIVENATQAIQTIRQNAPELALMSADDLIKSSVKGNLIGAGVAFISEAIFHSVRLVIYFVIDENKRQEFIDKGYAVTPEKYIKRITELGGACLAGGGLAALATLGAGALFGITGGAALTAISILFGVIGYLVGRALTKMVSDRVKTYLINGYKYVMKSIKHNIQILTSNIEVVDAAVLRNVLIHVDDLEMQTLSFVRRFMRMLEEIRSTAKAVLNDEITHNQAESRMIYDYEDSYNGLKKLSDDHQEISNQIDAVMADIEIAKGKYDKTLNNILHPNSAWSKWYNSTNPQISSIRESVQNIQQSFENMDGYLERLANLVEEGNIDANTNGRKYTQIVNLCDELLKTHIHAFLKFSPIEILPSTDLTFTGPFTNTTSTELFILNNTNSNIEYEIEAIPQISYQIDPPGGLVAPETRTEIKVYLLPLMNEQTLDNFKEHLIQINWWYQGNRNPQQQRLARPRLFPTAGANAQLAHHQNIHDVQAQANEIYTIPLICHYDTEDDEIRTFLRKHPKLNEIGGRIGSFGAHVSQNHSTVRSVASELKQIIDEMEAQHAKGQLKNIIESMKTIAYGYKRLECDAESVKRHTAETILYVNKKATDYLNGSGNFIAIIDDMKVQFTERLEELHRLRFQHIQISIDLKIQSSHASTAKEINDRRVEKSKEYEDTALALFGLSIPGFNIPLCAVATAQAAMDECTSTPAKIIAGTAGALGGVVIGIFSTLLSPLLLVTAGALAIMSKKWSATISDVSNRIMGIQDHIDYLAKCVSIIIADLEELKKNVSFARDNENETRRFKRFLMKCIKDTCDTFGKN